jgi:hypothetical protein
MGRLLNLDALFISWAKHNNDLQRRQSQKEHQNATEIIAISAELYNLYHP